MAEPILIRDLSREIHSPIAFDRPRQVNPFWETGRKLNFMNFAYPNSEVLARYFVNEYQLKSLNLIQFGFWIGLVLLSNTVGRHQLCPSMFP